MFHFNSSKIGLTSRYTENSCSSLEPQYVQENYVSLSLGPDNLGGPSPTDQNNFFGAPKKLNNRQPPFEIETDFIEYRRNKKYTGTTANMMMIEYLDKVGEKNNFP